MVSAQAINKFRKTVYEYYNTHKRPMPWRDKTDGYSIVVSELMLQQTQVPRVIEKFNEFMALFPNWKTLADASQAAVVQSWSGLGYNRRALHLHKTAQIVARQYNSELPEDSVLLTQLPGIGPATAAAIQAYAFNMPVVYVETNIRTVFIHHFFADKENVDDATLLPIIRQALDKENPREWYWALMDYGTHLKKTIGNISKQSKQYVKQSSFRGSNREARGAILKVLKDKAQVSENELYEIKSIEKERLENALAQLEKEGFVIKKGNTIRLQ